MWGFFEYWKPLSQSTCSNLHEVPKMVRLVFIKIYLGRLASQLLKGSGNKIYIKVTELFNCTNNSSYTKEYVTSPENNTRKQQMVWVPKQGVTKALKQNSPGSKNNDHRHIFYHSFIILSDDRSKASSKTIPPHSAI